MTDFGKNFPIDEYYRQNIVDARTVSRKGSWWSAIVLIKDPRNEENFIAIYRWQQIAGQWKAKGKFNIRKRAEGKEILNAIQQFTERLPE